MIITMLKKPSLFICLLFGLNLVFAQKNHGQINGEVSFVTSNSIYVKLEHTGQIQVGDSLFLNGKPGLVVQAKSSRSLVCHVLDGIKVEKGNGVVFYPKAKPLEVKEKVVEKPIVEEKVLDKLNEEEEEPEKKRKEVIRGRFSVSNYQNIANQRDNRNRLMTRFWVDAEHIGHSRFSFYGHVNYRQILQANINRPATYFNVYNLALKYQVSPGFHMTLGRRINPKVASLGAIDGLQIEKTLGKNYLGAILGSRPDIGTMNFNPNLLEYGAYAGRSDVGKHIYAQTTAGVIEQRNRGRIDRRYAYFQHSSTLFRRFMLFSSVEMDLYQSINGVATHTVRLPNLYVSGTYRFGKMASFMLSYDSRKRILFYETFQTEIEQLLNDDLAREGVRARFNLRPTKYLSIGLSYAQRFQNDRQNKSDNLYGSLSYSKLPLIGGRLSITYNQNKSNYLTSNILSNRYRKELISGKLDMGLYYRMASYQYFESGRIRTQHYYGGNLDFHAGKKWGISLAAERSDFNQETNYRLYARIVRRFSRIR